MRKKIAKRLRREAMRKGAVIIYEHYVREPGWKKKDCGYSVTAKYKGWEVLVPERDMLEAYRTLLWAVNDDEFGKWGKAKADDVL